MAVRRAVPFLSCLILLAFAVPAHAAPGDPVWTKVFDGPAAERDRPVDVAVDPKIPYLVFSTSTSVGVGTHADIVTMALDAYTGKRVWTHRYDGPAHGRDHAVAMTVDGYDRVIVTGNSRTTTGSTSTDVVTLVYDATTGTRIWKDRFSMSAHSSDSPAGLAAGNGDVYVLVAGTDHGGIVAYDSSGVRAWHRTVTDLPLANLVGLDELGGYLFASGTTFKDTGGTSYFVLGMHELDGSTVWTRRYDGPTAQSATAYDATVSGTSFLITGIADDFAAERITTIAYDPHDGRRFWLRSIDPQAFGNSDAGPKLAGNESGTSIALAATSYLGGVSTFLTRSYGSDGSTQWTARENGPNDSGVITDVAIDGAGRVVVVGQGTTTGSPVGPLSVSYSSTGAPAWRTAVAPMTTSDFAAAVAIQDFRVYVGSAWNDDIRVDQYGLT